LREARTCNYYTSPKKLTANKHSSSFVQEKSFITSGPGQAGQDEGGQDDGGRGQVDELLRPAEVVHPDSAGSTLSRSGDLSRSSHRGHLQDGQTNGKGQFKLQSSSYFCIVNQSSLSSNYIIKSSEI
jgi:hypothetical protein